MSKSRASKQNGYKAMLTKQTKNDCWKPVVVRKAKSKMKPAGF